MGSGDEIRQLHIFRGLQPEELELIVQACGIWEVGKGQYIFRAGDESQNLYIIREGEVEVLTPLRFLWRKQIVKLGAGEVFGELAFVDTSPRNASVRTTEPSVLLSLTRADFRKIGRKHPQIQLIVYRNIAKTLVHRLRMSDELLGRTYWKKRRFFPDDDPPPV